MKLTKGKIAKLFNKQKQSLKKRKNRKYSYNHRTFRNKNNFNLHNNTLKQIVYEQRGANDDPEDESKSETNGETNDTTRSELEDSILQKAEIAAKKADKKKKQKNTQ
jgi:hypothetical protein